MSIYSEEVDHLLSSRVDAKYGVIGGTFAAWLVSYIASADPSSRVSNGIFNYFQHCGDIGGSVIIGAASAVMTGNLIDRRRDYRTSGKLLRIAAAAGAACVGAAYSVAAESELLTRLTNGFFTADWKDGVWSGLAAVAAGTMISIQDREGPVYKLAPLGQEEALSSALASHESPPAADETLQSTDTSDPPVQVFLTKPEQKARL